MFRRSRPKIRVYENRRHGWSFKATINFLIRNDVELVGLQNCNLRFWKFWKFLKCFKIFNNFFLFQNFPPQNQNFQKTVQHVRWQCLVNMSTKCQVDIFKNGWDMTENSKNRHFSRHFGTLTVIFRILFFGRFWCFKKCIRDIFCVLCENLT